MFGFVCGRAETLTIEPCTPSFQDDHMIARVPLAILRPQPLPHAAIGRIEIMAKVGAMIVEFVAKVGAVIFVANVWMWAAVKYHGPEKFAQVSFRVSLLHKVGAEIEESTFQNLSLLAKMYGGYESLQLVRTEILDIVIANTHDFVSRYHARVVRRASMHHFLGRARFRV